MGRKVVLKVKKAPPKFEPERRKVDLRTCKRDKNGRLHDPIGRVVREDGTIRADAGIPGRPLGGGKRNQNLTKELRSLLREVYSDGTTRGHRLMKKLLEVCDNGDVGAIKLVFERVDGKVPETVNLNQRLYENLPDEHLMSLLNDQDEQEETEDGSSDVRD